MSERQVFWTDDAQPGRVVILSDNPVAQALRTIAEAAGREVVLISEDDGGPGLPELGSTDAVVLCDHDAPDAPAALRAALASDAAYVALRARRSRAARLLDELVEEGVEGLDKLHVPAGLDLGGKAPGEIALSVAAEIQATGYGRAGGSMRGW